MTGSRDIDRILRHLAGRDQVTDLDSGRRWERLRRLGDAAQRARQRTRRRTLVLATSLGLLLIGVAMWRDVGTEDFTLVPTGPGPRGQRVFSGRHRPLSYAVTGDTSGNEASARLGEELLSRTEGGEGRLTHVFGATIHGRTQLIAAGEVQTSRGPQKINLNVPIPVNDKPTEESMATLGRFVAAHLKEVGRAIESGQARALAPVDFAVAGKTIHCKRWQFDYPEFGPVIYWYGVPVP